jgi:hypothetical protein
MVRAPSGRTPRRSLTMIAPFKKRRYRPAFEALERKQLLSVGTPACVLAPPVPAMALVKSQSTQAVIYPCGTGKSVVIITS